MILGLSSPLAHASAEEWAARHRALGCGAVVFPVSCEDTRAQIESYRDAAAGEGLAIAEVGIWRNVLAADPVERKKAVAYAIGQLRLADEIGAACCVNIVGTPYGPVWDGGYAGNFSKEAWKLAVESIRLIIDEAAPRRTKFAIETMPWMIPSGPDEYLCLLDEVERDEFAVHLDIVNMINCPQRYFFNTEFIEECFDKLGSKVCSCHIKDVRLLPGYTFQLLECACGEGSLDLEKYVEEADKTGRSIPMIIEHLKTDAEYLDSLAYVRRRLGC